MGAAAEEMGGEGAAFGGCGGRSGGGGRHLGGSRLSGLGWAWTGGPVVVEMKLRRGANKVNETGVGLGGRAEES